MQDFVFKKLEKDIGPNETWIIDDEVPITGKKIIYVPSGVGITIKALGIDITSDIQESSYYYIIDIPVDKLFITNNARGIIKIIYIGSYT